MNNATCQSLECRPSVKTRAAVNQMTLQDDSTCVVSRPLNNTRFCRLMIAPEGEELKQMGTVCSEAATKDDTQDVPKAGSSSYTGKLETIGYRD